jgi:hypothetical protein
MVDREQIHKIFNKWFLANDSESVEVTINGVVNVASSVEAQIRGEDFPNGELPVQFGRIDGDFRLSYCELTSLKGMPTEITGLLNLTGNKLTSLVGCTQKIGGFLRLRSNPQLKTLDGFPTQLGEFVSLDWTPNLPLLRTLLAKQGVALWANQTNVQDQNNAQKVEKILNKYHSQGKRALFECQKELEDEGFEGNARW